MMQFIFFAISALVLLLGHLLAWLAVVKFFALTALNAKVMAAVAVAVLFFSIILAFYLIHKWDNLFTRWYYILAGVWMGALVNFGLMLLAALIIKFLGPQLGFVVTTSFLRAFLIFGTLVLTTFGLFNAFTPRVKEYEVRIKDLPPAWEGKKVVHISDVHLGPVYRERFFSRVIDRINRLEPEAVFITGDLFDGMEADFSWLNHPFAKLKTKKGVFYSFGNHDLYLGFDRVHELLKDGQVTILDDKLEIVDGLQIIGVNYSFNQDFNLYEAIFQQVGYSEKKPSLLLYHEPKNTQFAVKAGIDLQLSGHTHRGQLFPFNFLARMAYKGYGYGLFQINGFSLVVNSGLGTWGPPLRTINRSEIVQITLRAL